MCGIVGSLGAKNTSEALLHGLTTLEYRGYDSAGITQYTDGNLTTCKSVGRVQQLKQLLMAKEGQTSRLGIGHTRWATHGTVTTANAHPHTSSDGSIAVVHNGIIENHQVLRSFLESQGLEFKSQTDTEVIPQLIQYHYSKTRNMQTAFEKALEELKGAYAIAMVSSHEPQTLYAAKLSSPLVLGIHKTEHYVTSDPSALPANFSEVIFLDDYELVTVTESGYTIKNFEKQTAVSKSPQALDEQVKLASKGNFEHFMLKEIFDAPETIRAATAGRIHPDMRTIKLGGLESVTEQLRYIDRIVIVACGTSYYAGMVGEYLIEELAGIPVEVQLASEFKYRSEPFSRSTAILAISQSGETADTIAALKKVESYGVLRLGIVNAPGSTIARMTDAGVYCHAGPEYSVASTKAFVAQVSVLALIALHLSEQSTPKYEPLLKELSLLDKKVAKILEKSIDIAKVAKEYAKYTDMLFIGRGYGYPGAAEGALKLKEVSYIHAEGYAAGEMKHGPLAMIDEQFPTFAITPHDDLFEKTVSNIEEIRARKGPVIALTDKRDKHLEKLVSHTILIPATLPQLQPILSAVALQLFAYYVAVEKGMDVDRPRNLAKSVTVE